MTRGTKYADGVTENCLETGKMTNPLRVKKVSNAGLDGIVARIHLHTPRFAPAALSSMEVSGNRGNDKTP